MSFRHGVLVSSLNSLTNSPDHPTKLKPAKKLSLMLHNSPLAMIEWDNDLVIVGWNAAAAEMFSFFEDEAVGQRVDRLLDQREICDLENKGDWMSCDHAGILRSHIGLSGKKRCRWFHTPFTVKGQRVGTMATIVDITHHTALSNEELRAQLQSRTQVLKHTVNRLQSAMQTGAKTSAALQKSENQFASLVNNIPGVLYQFCLHTDGGYSVPYISTGCESIYELSADDVLATPEQLIALIHPDDRLSLELSMRQSAESLTPWRSEHRITTPNGSEKWVEMNANPQPTAAGNILWSGIVTDITARKRADQQQQTDHTFLTNLVNGLSSPLFAKNANHQLILANNAFCEFVGRSHADIIGKTDHDFMPKPDADGIWAYDEHILLSGQSKTTENYFTTNQAQKKFISTHKTRFYGIDNQPYLLGTIRDLTEQVIAQKALKENETQLKKLAANVPGMLYQFRLSADLKPSFTFVSSNSKSLFNFSPAQIKADANVLIALVHPEDREAFDHSIGVSAQTLQDWQWQGRFSLPNSQTVWMQGASRPERLPDNSIVWDGLLMDITRDKQAEADLQASEMRLREQTQQLKATLTKLKQTQVKLIQSEKMSSLGQLVAGIAHEINNPVNFIHGNLNHVKSYSQDMLQLIRLYQAHYPTPNSVIQELIDNLELDYVINDLPKLLNSLQEGTCRIQKIVLSLRNFSRLDESGLKRTDLHEGLENSLMLLGSRLKETVARPEIEIVKAYECVPNVDCFASQLNQVFMNILTNAIDAIDQDAANRDSRETAQIILQTFQKDNRVVVQITNTGSPIPSEVSQQMFDPFFTTKPVGKGTGMGLSISYQTVVGLHKGTLEYKQTAEQKNTFTIEIPISQM